MIKVVGSSQIGLVRKTNQDKYVILNNESQQIHAFMVLDGVGGSKAGDVASATVSVLFKDAFNNIELIKDYQHLKKWTHQVMININDELYRLAHMKNQFHGMSTTCILVLISPWGNFYVNIGDSRLYMIDLNDQLVQLSTDHSLVNDLILQGNISQEEANSHPMRHAVTNALGIYNKLRCDIVDIQLPFKLLMLCSDGVSGYVEHDIINEILCEPIDLEARKHKLNQAVLKTGAYDNFTFILWEI